MMREEKLKDEEEGEPGTVPVCRTCGSERVARDAWACWNVASGLWELETVFDQEWCHQCEGETHFDWKRAEAGPRQKVRELNDRFRRDGIGHGSVVITAGVKAFGIRFLHTVAEAVQSFEGFSEENDPWGEHDFGSVKIEGETIFWKIDHYSPDLQSGSVDPANEALTHRVLTFMLASEY